MRCLLQGLAAAAILIAVAACASGSAPGRCRFDACGEDEASLRKVTAEAVGAAFDQVTILRSERQFAGAVVIWRASIPGRRYECREGRDTRTRAVHYVDCRPSTSNGALNAFP